MKTKLNVDLFHNGQECKAGTEIDLPPDLAAIFSPAPQPDRVNAELQTEPAPETPRKKKTAADPASN